MNTSKTDNPFLFAFGVPRSGTTLLQRMLNSHPELAVANDSHFIPRALELTDKSLIDLAKAGQPIPLTPELANQLHTYHRFYRLGISDEEFKTIREQSTTYQQLVAGLYDCFAKHQGKSLSGEKTPDYLRRMSLLHGLFPNAKLIHLVRDGRNVALSLLQWATPKKGPGRIALWEKSPIAVSAMWWRWMVMESRDQAAAIDPACQMEISYENLVSNPEEKMREACKFLGFDFSQQMVDYHKGKSKPKKGMSAKKAWLSPQAGLRDFRTAMAPEQQELFEALAGDALEAFGYPLHCSSFSQQTTDAAKEYKAWWEQHFMSRHNAADPDKPTEPAATITQ